MGKTTSLRPASPRRLLRCGTALSDCTETARDQLGQALCRLDSEPLQDEPAAEAVFTERLAEVPLPEVGRDRARVGALAKWLTGNGEKARLERGAEARGSSESFAEVRPATEPQLPEPLTLDQQPVVVPVGKRSATNV